MNLTELRQDVARAEKALEKAQKALEAAEQLRLQKEVLANFPIGCKVRTISEGKRLGIVQVFKEGDLYQDRIMTSNMPDPGDVVVRELMENGRPGRRIWTWRSYGYMWIKAK